MESIVKTFPGVKALDGVSLDVKAGEVHALCGENGAGKSTLMKIIVGAQGYTSGHIYMDGEDVVFHSTKDAERHGIAILYISHRMDEIFQTSDRRTVFRDGKHIATKSIKDTDYDDVEGKSVEPCLFLCKISKK